VFLNGRNARGYEIAKRFRGKLSHVAPVWFQLRGAAHAPEITGRQDVDLEWIHAMRGGSPEQCAGRAVRVVPRVVVEEEREAETGGGETKNQEETKDF
jgi:hypothetical protein